MKNHPFFIIALLALTNCMDAQPLEGEYYGEMSILDEWHYIRLQPKDDKFVFRLPYEDGPLEYELEALVHEEKNTSFRIVRLTEEWNFKGKWETSEQLSGKVQLRGFQGDFVLHKKQSLDEEEWPKYIGTYRLPSGLVIKIRKSFNNLEVHSPLSQQMCILRYREGEPFYTNSGEYFQFSNFDDGHFQQLKWADRNGNALVAQRFDAYQTREVTIYTRKDTIAGTLFTPKKSGKHPACLITPGAGRLDRTNNFLEAEIFASYGIATLVVDKPGTGKSSGNHWSNSFIDKKDLAVDLYHWMEEQPEIDKTRIGLWGASQGSRIAIMAASELDEPAFLILAAHPIITRMNQQLYAIAQHHRGQFYPETVIVQANDIWRRFNHQVSQEKIDANLLVEIQALRGNYPELYLPTVPDTRLPVGYHPSDIYGDPVDYLANIKCPILSINGELDELVPVQTSVKRLEDALQKHGHKDYTKIWFPEANHSFIIPGFRIAPGLLMKQVNWMRARVF